MQSAGFWKQSWNTFKRICALPLIALVKFYQLCISPFTPPSCRFTPTCSQYALEALRKYGPLKGLWLTLRRLARLRPGTLNPQVDKARKAQMLPGTIKTIRPFRVGLFFQTAYTCPRRAEKPEEPAKGRHTAPPGRSRYQSHVPGQCSAKDSNSSVT